MAAALRPTHILVLAPAWVSVVDNTLGRSFVSSALVATQFGDTSKPVA